MRFKRVVTSSGSVYEMTEAGICIKTDKDGNRVDAFKPFSVKAIPVGRTSFEAIHETSEGEPVVGMSMYIAGRDVWWLTTPVVSVE